MVIRILNARDINKLQEYVDRYNNAVKVADKNFFYGLILGFTDGTNYIVNYVNSAFPHDIKVVNTLRQERAAKC